jgi:hypothetical protein
MLLVKSLQQVLDLASWLRVLSLVCAGLPVQSAQVLSVTQGAAAPSPAALPPSPSLLPVLPPPQPVMVPLAPVNAESAAAAKPLNQLLIKVGRGVVPSSCPARVAEIGRK